MYLTLKSSFRQRLGKLPSEVQGNLNSQKSDCSRSGKNNRIFLRHPENVGILARKKQMHRLSLILSLLAFAGCQPATPAQDETEAPQPEAISFDGHPLYPPSETEASRRSKDSLLAIACQNYEADTASLEHIVWLGRRTAYLSRYQEAIAIYTRGLALHPGSPELYRHRGHRYLSTRQLDKAIADFERAADLVAGRPVEIEPDGIPNKLNIPLSSLQFNIWYHWALAYYLKGDFGKAAELYEQCMAYSTNPDLLVATADWLYMAYRRQGQAEKAAALLEQIPDGLEIIENDSYYRRLLMYKGQLAPEELLDLDNSDPERQLDIVTQGYGLGNWYFYNGQKDKAEEVFKKILETNYWPAFGYIAAEAELGRGGR